VENAVETWLERLVTITRELQAAAVSVVVPIKTLEGMTSTGLDLNRKSGYTLRRVTVKELSQLPRDVITRLDVCQLFGLDPLVAGALLVNTGALCMNLRYYPWFEARWPGFYIDDRLVWNTKGVPEGRTAPEDWNFSRWLFNKEWRYYATSGIVSCHEGNHTYHNRGSWGMDSDTLPKQSSIKEYEAS
jgi:hypothetical protein